MKKWSLVALLDVFLIISPISVCRGGSSVDGQKMYYDGTITVNSKGADDQDNIFDESTTITEFKIEHWNVIPGMIWQGYASRTGSNADVRVNNRFGETSITFGPKKVHFEEGLISLSIQKKDGETYIYSLQVSPPNVKAGTFLVPVLWVLGTGDMPGDDFTPLEIHGEMTQFPWKNGVPTKMTWVLNRHIR